MTQPYFDPSYPPIHPTTMRYERGDGAIVTLDVKYPQDHKTVDIMAPEPAQDDIIKQHAKATITLPKGVPITINPSANVQTYSGPVAQRPGKSQTQNLVDDTILDHAAVGGRFTAFILFYGGEEYYDLHKRCLTSFLETTPASRIDLRVGSNALNQKSLNLIESYAAQGFITKHYRHDENAYKYPVMREMFYDDSHPITTKWVLWFDDDSICDVEPNWLNTLGACIAQYHTGKDAHMIGASYVWTANVIQKQIMESRPWHKGRPWRLHNGRPGGPNANRIIFTTGGFWALTTEAMRAADIPDLGTGLTHTGGDWQIGEQIYQAGYGLKQFNANKQFVRTSSVPRRGVTMPTIDKGDRPQAIVPPGTVVTVTSNPSLRRITDI